MGKYNKLREDVLSGKVEVDDLIKYKDEFEEYVNHIALHSDEIELEEIEAFLRLCLNYYTYSEDGSSLIRDIVYDAIMERYLSRGGERFFYADPIQSSSKWSFIKHRIPGIVGTLDKIYTYQEFTNYLMRYGRVDSFRITPKFDGVSCSIEVSNGMIVSAATRYDGIMGQDITKLVQNASNANTFMKNGRYDGLYKCELCVSSDSYRELYKEKPYANRRSATTGIVNTPSNLNLAQYITILPLLFYNDKFKRVEYTAPYHTIFKRSHQLEFWEDINNAVTMFKDVSFPFRIDGVVITPIHEDLNIPNELDLLEHSIAFKINTSEGLTRVKYGYMSVGRLGKAVPMVKVEPVEVNETRVEDVSLGSYAKFNELGLREGEPVIVFSAGDVIPQLKLPSARIDISAPPLEILRRCPYCDTFLTVRGGEMYCLNEYCDRVVSGKIANFLVKMGIRGFSDKSVEMIYKALNISTIPEFLSLTKDTIMTVDGFDVSSATSLEEELQIIKHKPVTVSKLIGALGIDKISQKKCQKIFSVIPLRKMLKSTNMKSLFYELQNADGIAQRTASAFIEFLESNYELIRELLSIMHDVRDDIIYEFNVVFTGCRPDQEIEDKLANLGIEVGDNVTSRTLAVVSSSMESNSSKMQQARKRNIEIWDVRKLDTFIQAMRETITMGRNPTSIWHPDDLE